MSRPWRVLDLTTLEGSVRSRRGRISICNATGDEHDVALADVGVVLLGQRVDVSSGALHHLAKYDVVTLTCDWRGVPYGGHFAWADHTRVAARQIAQARVSKPRLKNAWMQLVRAKILGQATTLALVDELAADHLVAHARSVRSGDPNNIEASAARWYWSRLFEDARFVRNPEGDDRMNSLLNYGYGVVRGFGIRAVLGAGLSPALGTFHRNRGNFFNLVEDLLEPCRPVIDATVLRLPPEASLESHEVKTALVATAFCPFDESGITVEPMLADLAQRYGRYVEGEIERLDVAAWTDPILGLDDAAW